MKFAQFVALNFGKSVLRHLRLLPDATSANSSRPSRGLNRDILLEKLCGQLLRTARCPKLQVAVVWRPRAADDGRPRLLAHQDDLPESQADRSLAVRGPAYFASRTGPFSRAISSRTPPHRAARPGMAPSLPRSGTAERITLPRSSFETHPLRAKVLLCVPRMRHHAGARARDEASRRVPQMLSQTQRGKISRAVPLHARASPGQIGGVTCLSPLLFR